MVGVVVGMCVLVRVLVKVRVGVALSVVVNVLVRMRMRVWQIRIAQSQRPEEQLPDSAPNILAGFAHAHHLLTVPYCGRSLLLDERVTGAGGFQATFEILRRLSEPAGVSR
jgi:hypothetical protein